MRILGIDHGTKRIGLALSDELQMIAQPFDFFPAEPFVEFLARLEELIREKSVEQIVIGMPRNMNGTYGPATDKVKKFIEQLKETIQVPIRAWDERLTSVEANRLLIQGNVRREKRKEKVDMMAAAILLQSFLDSQQA